MSPGTMNQIWHAWRFASNAYRPDEDGYAGDARLKNTLRVDSLRVVKRGNMTVLIAEHSGRLIISFAGSNDWEDWINNLRSIAPDYYRGSFVGDGFLNNYLKVMQVVVEACRKTDLKICIYGHSAGGAAAYLHADELNRLGIRWHEVVTFESPRVFSRSLAAKFDDLIDGRSCIRVTHGSDPVPHGPAGVRFSHVGNEVWFPRSVSKRAQENPSIVRRVWQTVRAIRFISSGLDHTCERVDRRLSIEKCLMDIKR